MPGNESVLAQILQYYSYPIAMYFYALIGAILGFTGYEVFNRHESRKEQGEFYKGLLELHKAKVIRDSIKEDEKEQEKKQ